jgi:hypothetical protein
MSRIGPRDPVKSHVEVLKAVYGGALSQSIPLRSSKGQGSVLIDSNFFAWLPVVCETRPGVVAHYSIDV